MSDDPLDRLCNWSMYTVLVLAGVVIGVLITERICT